MSTPQIFSMILIMGVITWCLRAWPFFFQDFLSQHPFIDFIKTRFPLMMMLILVVYASDVYKGKPLTELQPTLLAMAATTLLQLGFKNYLISLFGGIAVYVALVNQVF